MHNVNSQHRKSRVTCSDWAARCPYSVFLTRSQRRNFCQMSVPERSVLLSSTWSGLYLQTLNPLIELFLCISCQKAQNQGITLFLQLCLSPMPLFLHLLLEDLVLCVLFANDLKYIFWWVAEWIVHGWVDGQMEILMYLQFDFFF